MKNLFKFRLITGLAALVAQPGIAAPIQWKVEDGGNGHYYEKFEAQVTWHEAKELAEALGGHLATITSEAENIWVFDNAGGVNYWLGGTDEAEEGKWTWVTGEEWVYDNWYIPGGEPNNGGGGGVEHFLEYYIISSPVWNDASDSHERGFIVEYESIGEPCEATATLSPDLKLHIPQLDYQTAFGLVLPLWVDMQILPTDDDQLLFEVTEYGELD